MHALGPRAVAEFLAEVSGAIGGLPAIQSLLVEYQRLTPGMVRAAGGDRFPPRAGRSYGASDEGLASSSPDEARWRLP